MWTQNGTQKGKQWPTNRFVNKGVKENGKKNFFMLDETYINVLSTKI